MNQLARDTVDVMTQLDTENPERQIVKTAMWEFEVVQEAVRVISGNVPEEETRETLNAFKKFYENAKAEYDRLQHETYSLYDEISSIKKDIMDTEHVFYAYKETEKRIKTQIELCGVLHPFRKAELKEQLQNHQNAGCSAEPNALYAELQSCTQKYEEKKKLCKNLEKDFQELQDISEKLEKKLTAKKEFERAFWKKGTDNIFKSPLNKTNPRGS